MYRNPSRKTFVFSSRQHHNEKLFTPPAALLGTYLDGIGSWGVYDRRGDFLSSLICKRIWWSQDPLSVQCPPSPTPGHCRSHHTQFRFIYTQIYLLRSWTRSYFGPLGQYIGYIKFVRQNFFSGIFPQKFGRQKFGHRNLSTKIWTLKFSHRNFFPSKFSPRNLHT